MDFTITPIMSDSDVSGKAYVHWQTWRESFKGIVNPRYLDSLTLDRCLNIASKWRKNILVAKEESGRVIGFVSYGASHDPDMQNCGEVLALYVLKDYQRQGVGSALMKAALQKIGGFDKIAVWMLRANETAIAFCEKFGFRPDGYCREIQLGRTELELRMVCEPTQITQFDEAGRYGGFAGHDGVETYIAQPLTEKEAKRLMKEERKANRKGLFGLFSGKKKKEKEKKEVCSPLENETPSEPSEESGK